MIPKRLSPKCPTDLKLLTSFVKSGLCFIFATPFCTVFVYSNVYQSHFFCTYCVLQTFFVTLVNLRFTIKFCFTKLARKMAGCVQDYYGNKNEKFVIFRKKVSILPTNTHFYKTFDRNTL